MREMVPVEPGIFLHPETVEAFFVAPDSPALGVNGGAIEIVREGELESASFSGIGQRDFGWDGFGNFWNGIFGDDRFFRAGSG